MTDEQTTAVADLHTDWVFGWDVEEDGPPFVFRERAGRFYDWETDDAALYDDFDPGHRIARGPAEYGDIWQPAFRRMRSARHGVADGPRVVVDGSLAASTLVFVARLEMLDGTVTGVRTNSSLVWRRRPDGWRIVREHNSSVVLGADEIEPAMAAARPGR
ncbi:YybH family protein [Actinorugispora endophytica]|uniref:SnoaL-like protein n=1 Tax=Actinorugispora endophytica TaxID=1605990 RepID=A0A4R6V380_9ACTN|nr:nuclear transport factor 2 family protein [Actinorugispora endophytica]TDQ52987.1 SnoaL-like protein [Actinorugispora endophytica]